MKICEKCGEKYYTIAHICNVVSTPGPINMSAVPMVQAYEIIDRLDQIIALLRQIKEEK